MNNVDRLLKNALEWMGDNGGEYYAGVIRARLAALEGEAARARERVLEDVLAESSRPKGEIGARIAGDDQDAMLGSLDALEERVRALKSKPAQVHGFEVCADASMAPGTFRLEMASEENGLLPPKRRREHEYGEEYEAEFGSKVANCTRGRCQAYRVRSRGGKHALFYQRPYHTPTSEPGPCEVES